MIIVSIITYNYLYFVIINLLSYLFIFIKLSYFYLYIYLYLHLYLYLYMYLYLYLALAWISRAQLLRNAIDLYISKISLSGLQTLMTRIHNCLSLRATRNAQREGRLKLYLKSRQSWVLYGRWSLQHQLSFRLVSGQRWWFWSLRNQGFNFGALAALCRAYFCSYG